MDSWRLRQRAGAARAAMDAAQPQSHDAATWRGGMGGVANVTNFKVNLTRVPAAPPAPSHVAPHLGGPSPRPRGPSKSATLLPQSRLFRRFCFPISGASLHFGLVAFSAHGGKALFGQGLLLVFGRFTARFGWASFPRSPALRR